MKYLYTSLILTLITCTILPAQNFNWELGIQLGGSNYTGDVGEPSYFKMGGDNVGYGFFLRYLIHPNVSFRMNAYSGKFSGK